MPLGDEKPTFENELGELSAILYDSLSRIDYLFLCRMLRDNPGAVRSALVKKLCYTLPNIKCAQCGCKDFLVYTYDDVMRMECAVCGRQQSLQLPSNPK